MGFTVALFVAEAAGGYPSLKLGALASFSYLALAVLLGKLLLRHESSPAQPEEHSPQQDCLVGA